VYLYLLNKEEEKMSFTTYYYAAIFYNQKEDKVIGKAVISNFANPESLRDIF
jgi:hypothetical protein